MNYCEMELYHFGIKGMKWGVRRYQNKDGTLTPAGKKRASQEYKKHIDKAQEDLNKNYTSRYVKAYNKAADEANNGLIEKYNADYAKKLGSKANDHDYFNDKEYNEGYERMFDEIFVKHYNNELAREIKSNPSYQKAKELCDKYNMTSFDELARTTTKDFDENLKRYL